MRQGVNRDTLRTKTARAWRRRLKMTRDSKRFIMRAASSSAFPFSLDRGKTPTDMTTQIRTTVRTRKTALKTCSQHRSAVAVLDSCGCVNKFSNVTPLKIVFNICFTLHKCSFFYFEIMEKQCRNDLYSDGGSCGFRGFEPKRTLPLLLSSSGTLATSTLLVSRITCDFYHWFVGRGWSTW